MVKKIFVFILALLSISPATYAKDLVVRKKAGEYLIEARIDRNPPILGENNIEIEIIDASGAHNNDANVMINYYMPPMPRMAPMNYKTNSKLEGEKYQAALNFIAEFIRQDCPLHLFLDTLRNNCHTKAMRELDDAADNRRVLIIRIDCVNERLIYFQCFSG